MSNEENHLKNVASGIVMGVIVGGGLGLGACMYVFEGTLLFPGDTVLLGAVVCGTLGLIYGESFIEFMEEHYWWFW